ncbi:MAG: hypothetical protein E7286_01730 [Lachnospiraceae bacterium]|nr:hypothetical protein [Lachnospiraceae bacterium]
MKLLLKNRKQILYIVCFALLGLIDQRKGSVTGNMQLFWSNCTGLVLAPLLFCHYNIKDFGKKRYLIWTVVSLLCFTGFREMAQTMGVESPWPNVQLYSAFVNIFVYGFLIIRTVEDLWGKPFKVKQRFIPIFLCVMLLLMGLSRNDSIWPWYFLMVFGTFAFTDFSQEERRGLSYALADGIILGFLGVQGAAFVFRPYDEIRYLGMYANPNINALFYSIVYCATLVKLFFFLFEYSGKGKKLLICIAMFFSGAMWSFCLLTGCRTALLSMGAVTCVAGLLSLFRFRKKVALKGMGMVIGLVCCIIASFPVVYGCVRYIPAYFHHPVWFFEEYAEWKVHSWDPVDSEKYIEYETIVEYIGERLFGVTLPKKEENALINRNYYFPLLCSTAETISVETVPKPLITEVSDTTVARYHIYKYYLSELNMVGHLNEEKGVLVTDDYVARHAHNLYLQQAFDFGVPVGILFVGYLVLNLICLFRKAWKSQSTCNMGLLLWLVNGCAFGLFEMMWANGYLAFTLLFLTTCIAVVDEA